MPTEDMLDYSLRPPRLPAPVDDSLGAAPIDLEVRLGMYRKLHELRQFGKRAHDLFLQNLVKGTTHLSLGMEAIATGFGAAMRPDDYTFATYRGHAHSLARGMELGPALAELLGRENGILGGKGGSIFFEHKALLATKEDVADGEIVEPLGVARVVREGSDVTIAALALMVPRALEAAERLADDGISAEIVDVRSLVPLDTDTLLASVVKTGRFFTVEENPRLCGWGAELVSIVSEEAFWDLDGPSIRITTPHIPLPSAAALEDLALPSVDRIFETISRAVDSRVGA